MREQGRALKPQSCGEPLRPRSQPRAKDAAGHPTLVRDVGRFLLEAGLMGSGTRVDGEKSGSFQVCPKLRLFTGHQKVSKTRSRAHPLSPPGRWNFRALPTRVPSAKPREFFFFFEANAEPGLTPRDTGEEEAHCGAHAPLSQHAALWGQQEVSMGITAQGLHVVHSRPLLAKSNIKILHPPPSGSCPHNFSLGQRLHRDTRKHTVPERVQEDPFPSRPALAPETCQLVLR